MKARRPRGRTHASSTRVLACSNRDCFLTNFHIPGTDNTGALAAWPLPDFQAPMKGELLWVYEGLTEYLGTVLSARSGLTTPQQTRDYIALTASTMAHRAGRRWRSLQKNNAKNMHAARFCIFRRQNGLLTGGASIFIRRAS